MASYHGLTISGLASEQMTNLATALFMVPFFIFSASAGKLAEASDKADLSRWIKLFEIFIMAMALVGFIQTSASFLLTALFLMGVHSTFFGPIKYSILPQYLPKEDLLTGNAWIELSTFLAILLGQVLAGILVLHTSPKMIGLILVSIALFGYISSRWMPSAPATNPNLKLNIKNPTRDTVEVLYIAFRWPSIRAALLGISWFWLVGAIYTTQLTTFTREHLGGDVSVYTLLLGMFSIGIGIGSLWAAKLSHGLLKLNFVGFGALGMTFFGILLPLLNWPLARKSYDLIEFLVIPQHYITLIIAAFLGVSSGFFTVPLYTVLQTASPKRFRSQIIAANNIVNSFLVVIGILGATILLSIRPHISLLFMITAFINLIVLWMLIRMDRSFIINHHKSF